MMVDGTNGAVKLRPSRSDRHIKVKVWLGRNWSGLAKQSKCCIRSHFRFRVETSPDLIDSHL